MTNRSANYERGMAISHEPITAKAALKFRGRIADLPLRARSGVTANASFNDDITHFAGNRHGIPNRLGELIRRACIRGFNAALTQDLSPEVQHLDNGSEVFQIPVKDGVYVENNSDRLVLIDQWAPLLGNEETDARSRVEIKRAKDFVQGALRENRRGVEREADASWHLQAALRLRQWNIRCALLHGLPDSFFDEHGNLHKEIREGFTDQELLDYATQRETEAAKCRRSYIRALRVAQKIAVIVAKTLCQWFRKAGPERPPDAACTVVGLPPTSPASPSGAIQVAEYVFFESAALSPEQHRKYNVGDDHRMSPDNYQRYLKDQDWEERQRAWEVRQIKSADAARKCFAGEDYRLKYAEWESAAEPVAPLPSVTASLNNATPSVVISNRIDTERELAVRAAA